MANQDVIKIFIAYSRKDSSFLDEFRKHLTPLERSGKFKIWYDGKIEPGEVWEQSIKDQLHAAEIILLMISPDSLFSDYFYQKELTDALDRHKKGQAKVIPFILRPCSWEIDPQLSQLQALPKDAKPVTSWPSPDDAYNDTVHSLNNIYLEREKERIAAEKRRQAQIKKQRKQEQPEAQNKKRIAAEQKKKADHI